MARTCRLPLGLLAGLAIALSTTTAAQAAPAPAAVRVAVEGATGTIIPEKQVTTLATPVTRAGVTCSGTSAAGALEVAAGGAWDAVPDGGGGLTVNTVLGQTQPNALDPRPFVLFVNSVVYLGSPCAIELNAGDTVLYYVGSLPAGQISPGCHTTGRDGYCGSPDRTGPPAQITSIKEQQVFSRKSAPLTLSGSVSYDPNGVSDVRIRLTRSHGRKCHYFSALDDTFLRLKKCGADGPQLFSIGHSARWSYVLPRRPTPGRYTLDVQAVDKLGNASLPDARGRDRIVFFVK
jgi:hypothetical protein